MWQTVHDAWWRLATQHQPRTFSDTLTSRLLQAGSVAYRAAVSFRNTAYDRGWKRSVRLPCSVVSVGNLTVGGTGKTACTELIAKKLLAAGKRVAILSRGYGGSSARREYWLRSDGTTLMIDDEPLSDRDGIADEPQLLARRLSGVPVVVGAERARTGQLACSTLGAEVIVLDDGFQHRRVARDCEIVLIHARMPLGGWALLPRGPMREPLTSLSRAHVIVLTKADEAMEMLGALRERLRSVAPQAAFVAAVHAPTGLVDPLSRARNDVSHLGGLRVALLSSIGDPAGFETTVRNAHATVLWHRAFPDHHGYRPEDWTELLQRIGAQRPQALVTTEKDWMRLSASSMPKVPCPVWILTVEMRLIEGEDALDARLARLCPR